MNLNIFIIIAIFVLLIGGFVIWHYALNIYEVTVKPDKNQIYADNESILNIKVIPLNAWGFQPPFRKVKAKFTIDEGKDLVEIIKQENDLIVIKSKDKAGNLTIKVETENSLLPTLVEIKILPNSV